MKIYKLITKSKLVNFNYFTEKDRENNEIAFGRKMRTSIMKTYNTEMIFTNKDKANESLDNILAEFKKECYQVKTQNELYYVKDIWDQGELPYREIKYAYIMESEITD